MVILYFLFPSLVSPQDRFRPHSTFYIFVTQYKRFFSILFFVLLSAIFDLGSRGTYHYHFGILFKKFDNRSFYKKKHVCQSDPD